MAASVRVRPEGTSDADGTVRLPADAVDRLGVADGDTVAVVGSRRTVGRVVLGEPAALGERVRRNAGAEAGDEVTVEPVTAPTAEAVRLEVSRTVRGAESFLRRRLEGDPVLVGDTLEASFQGGTVRVTFTVRETRPSGPVVVTERTDLRVVGPDDGTPRLETGSAGFEDVGGVSWLEDLREVLTLPFERGEAFAALGGRPPGTALVHGPAGSGKTLLARTVANEAPVEGVAVPATAFLDDPDGLRDLSEEVVERSPAVLVLDDVDAVGRKDSGGGGPPSARASTVALRSLLDDLRRRDDVLVVGTATDPHDLDPSLRRGGRFDREFELPVPNRAGRRDVLETLVRDAPLDGVDLDALAGRTSGFVGADLRALVDEAVLRAVRRTSGGDADGAGGTGAAALTATDFEAALGVVEPSAMREVSAEVPATSFDDVGGLEDAKRELVRAVELPLRRPDLFEAAGVDPPRGVLLYGPPGTGKTLLARAVAGVTDANFIPVKGPELLDRYVGESERAVREVFRRARQTAPAVVFFDEVDALAPERSEGGSGSRTTERVVSQLLTEIDGLEARGEVVVIATTNRPELVDSALLRPGRLERAVPVSLPDAEAREEILRVHTREVSLEGVDLSDVAHETDGYSGGDLEAVVREAALSAIEERLRAERTDGAAAADVRVTADAFERALDTVGPSVGPEVRDHHRRLGERFDGRSARDPGRGPADPGAQ